MIHKIVQVQKIGNLLFDPLVLDDHQFSGDLLKNLVLDIVIVREISIPIELHLVQDTLTFITNDETLDLIKVLLSELIAIVFNAASNSWKLTVLYKLKFFISIFIKTSFSICICI